MASGSRVREPGSTSEDQPAPEGVERTIKRRRCGLDLDTLDCPICLEPMSAPIFMCNNGHGACAGCCKKLATGQCPSCTLPIGQHRCILLEKVIESLRIQCKYHMHGCKKMLPYLRRNKDEHEGMCGFRPFTCPVLTCNHEVPKSGLADHFLHNHNAEIVNYEKPDDDDPTDEMINSFSIMTDKGAYDRTLSQYVIVQVSAGSDDPEEQETEDSESELYLVHHQFHERHARYSFSVTSFGTRVSKYRLSVFFEREGTRLGSRPRKTFKSSHSIEGPVHDNRKDNALLTKVVRQGECLYVPKLCASQRDGLKFDVQFEIEADQRSV